MNVKRDKGLAYDIAQMIEALDIKQQICLRFGGSCTECPLGKLGVIDTRACDEIDKLTKRLVLAYRVVKKL